MLAEVTYNAGLMYQIGAKKFFLNRTVLVTDAGVIQRAEVTRGFSVHVVKRDEAKKKTRKVLRSSNGKTRRAVKKVRRSS